MRQSVVMAKPRWCVCRSLVRSIGMGSASIVFLLALQTPRIVHAQESTEASLAAYADAANYQTGGATDLAITAWKGFLKKYPRDPMASNAAHYLGVCYMQREQPDYAAAANAFSLALRNKKYDLREESLANGGWCLYSSAGEGRTRDSAKLKRALETFATLRKENPKSRYSDRALFYSGESAYGLGDARQAIDFYDQLLAMPEAQQSPLRCDAFYARGVAHEDLQQFDKAAASYKQLLAGCAQKEDLIIDVHMRLGDMGIRRKQFGDAIESFAAALASNPSPQDEAYALFRQGYALAQSDRPGEAASKYEELLRRHPDSQYSSAATLASAQSSYRGGDFDQAAARFKRVLAGKNNRSAATEAAHWLARIEISRGNVAEATRICRQQIASGLDGDYAVALRLDLGETLSMDPKSVEESMKVFEQTYRDAPKDPLAPRALYNAAFSAYQSSQPDRALKLSLEFIRQFPTDTLVPDVRFVAAECQFQNGQTDAAISTFKRLLETTGRDNIQRPIWIIRAATAANGAGKHDDAIAILQDNLDSLKQPAQQAEAQFLIGKAQLASGKADLAAKAFQASQSLDPKWKRSDEARLLAAQATLAAGDKRAAIDEWKRLIRDAPDERMADQARYKLAQLASGDGDFREAVTRYDEILKSRKDPALIPYALYGKGWSLIQLNDFRAALDSLDRVLNEHKNHPVQNDSVLARGITLRNLDRGQDARVDLETYLAIPATGTNLGHTLYELALIDQQEKRPAEAAERLERLVREVPDYPSMDKVLYELGWSYRESGDDKNAVKYFTNLIRRFSDTPLAAEAAYYVGQQRYSAGDWEQAAQNFQVAAEKTDDAELSEKAYYRLGWSRFKAVNYESSRRAFEQQASRHTEGKLVLDAMMMIGECRFRESKFEPALEAYSAARTKLQKDGDDSQTIRDRAERQVRELILLHGGQSASQLKRWQDSIDWFSELRKRFPATVYLPQAFYETGFAYQQLGDTANALKFYGEVADNYRNESAARARFMMGEIHFGQRQYDKAIPEFQRVMFGFNAEKSPAKIKNWQAKSGFEAGRCCELLLQQASTPEKQQKARKLATEFFTYVINKHPDHELVGKSKERLEAVKK